MKSRSNEVNAKKTGYYIEQNNHDAGQYLTFRLGDEMFAVGISGVREILEFDRITEVPNTPDFMLGVINLRGEVVPVVDLRIKFAVTETKKTVDTCIIITEIPMDGELNCIGALADSVKEVLTLEEDDIQDAPGIGTGIDTSFIKSMGKKDDTFIIILDFQKIFTLEELAYMGEEEQAVDTDRQPAK